MGSLFLGIWANGVSENSAILKWEKAHPPSLKIVDYVSQAKQMQHMSDPFLLQKSLRALSVNTDERGSFWLGMDSYWLVYFLDEGPPLVYCLNCKEVPKKWMPLGIGWKGFEKGMELIEQEKDRLKAISTSKKNQNSTQFYDPRAIHY